MTRRRVAIAALALTATIAAAQAQTAAPGSGPDPATPPPRTFLDENFTAGQLLQSCRAQVGSGLMFCYGYIGGVIDVHRRTVEAHAEVARFCAPRLKAEQRRRVFLEWALHSAEYYGLPAAHAVELALAQKFPCPGQRRGAS